MMSEFHFLRPEWLWALLPLAGLLSWSTLRKLHKGNWSRVVDQQLQAHVLIQNQTKRRGGSPVVFAIAGLLAITAMAGPTWQRLPLPVFKDETALIIALDLSSSMNAQDIKPSRLQRAHLKLIDLLRQRKTGQSALITYAADAFTVTPLTDDIETIITHIPNLTTDLMPAQGSRADIAIEKASELLQQTNIRKGEVLLITDGAKPEQLKKAAAKLKEQGHALLILGVGTTDGAPIPASSSGFIKNRDGAIVIAKLNEAELKGYGLYHQMTIDDRDINHLLRKHSSELMDIQHKPTELNTDTWRDEGPWLLLPLLLLAPLGFRRGLLVLSLCCLIPIPEPALAFSWQNLWLNDNQRAAKAFTTGESAKAAELFDDPAWQAAAQYRAGQHEKAVATLESLNDIESLYNKGNALAKLGNIPEAIKTYDQVLEKDSEHEDARHNRDLLKQQQQEQQQSDQQDQSSENDQKQDQSQQESQNKDSEQQQQSKQQSQQQDSESSKSEEKSQQQQQAEEKEQQAKAEEKKSEAEESEEQQAMATQEEDAEPNPEQQAIEQWLRRIPDDPAGLLRRKFIHQYRQNNSRKQEPEPW